MRIVVVGAGIAGLATSVRLALQGHQVDVFEANSYPGGKLTVFENAGYRFDAGPSLFTLPHLVDELFTLAGKNPKDHFSYIKKEVACRYFWDDQTELTAWADAEKFAAEAGTLTQTPPEAISLHLKQAALLYKITSGIFLERSLHQIKNYWHKDVWRALRYLPKLELTKTLNQVNAKRFQSPKLVQLFNRFATYNGSNPYQTPGVMLIIPHLEHNIGTYFPKGGMHAITQSIYELAVSLGVQFHFDAPVEEIVVEHEKVRGVITNSICHIADAVVSNMDVVPTYRKLLKKQPAPEKILSQPRSSSALIFYWGIQRSFPELDLHNIFFSNNYAAEFKAIFEDKTLYKDPTVYIHISSKDEPGDAPPGCENWFVMINVPGDTGQDWDALIPKAREWILNKLSNRLGVDVAALIETEDLLEPRLIEQKTSSYQGSLYGASSNNRMAAFFRHPNFSNHIQGLYFCGGSVHPGGGIPLCLNSAKIVAQTIKSKQ